MIGALIIVFREVIEAGLIVGIVAAVMRGVPRAGLYISGGVAAGVFGALLVAVFAGTLAAAAEGIGQELFNASVLFIAVGMLAWHNIWMAKHGREMAAELKAAGQAVRSGRASMMSLAIVVAVAVLREGSEVVLFLYGVLTQSKEGVGALALGGALGLVLGVALGWLSYAGMVRISPRYIFSVTGWLITFLAAGMAAQAVVFLEQAGVVNTLSATVWDTSAILPEGSIPGRILHVLIGYSESPTQADLLAYLATAVTIWLAGRLVHAKPARIPVQSAAAE